MISSLEDKKVLFTSNAHKEFYLKNLSRCRYQDVYHAALMYCLGIDRDTREHVDRIYDFKTGFVKAECLWEGWQTSGSKKIVRMAFNLYCNGTPSTSEFEEDKERLKECERYTVEDLFCCSYAPFFWQAIQIRYPEYCGAA